MADVTILPGDGQYDGSWHKGSEGEGGSMITSHPYWPPSDRNRHLCSHPGCNLAESAHVEALPF